MNPRLTHHIRPYATAISRKIPATRRNIVANGSITSKIMESPSADAG
ncbi:hypothetical protein OEM_17530 [Mycobacterium intracellulare subsp. yongonense 05-1390]|nr:hypothetical protein OEM_17530 [Mycobacterium intracellulare subsp. yongonense 05-1390]ARR77406.1 hypothetical protein MOTT12_01742 [Mycobacterium intracellulare subsp. yongonense]